VHSNGFSLVRKIVLKDNTFNLKQYVPELDAPLGETLLTPTRIYVKSVLTALKNADIHAICHITGGGFYENIPRALNAGQGVEINEKSWIKPPIFDFLAQTGKIAREEMFNVFNMGIGLIMIASEKEVDSICNILKANGEQPCLIGRVTNREGVVIIKG
jgi:phosphoribosylformylglycinamidine cyclo-ligase